MVNRRMTVPMLISEINLLDEEVEKSKSEIERIKEDIKKLEQTKKGDASNKLEELETKVISSLIASSMMFYFLFIICNSHSVVCDYTIKMFI